MNCYYCLNQLTEENKSVEHIIPNAIGGRVKSKRLLCEECNSMLGRTIDAAVCNQLQPLISFLNIKREKGSPVILKNLNSDSGEKYNLIEGRKPVLTKPTVEMDKGKNTFRIVARDEKELKKIIKQLKKKYPTIDDKDFEKKAQRQKYFMDEKLSINISVGSDEFIKGILKIAINAYLHFISRDTTLINENIKNLKNPKAISTDIVHHYYFEDYNFVLEDEVSHNILIEGNFAKKLLFCYIELFSSFAFIVNLNRNYQGKDFKFIYSYDVLKNKKIDKTFNVAYDGVLEENKTLLNNQFIAIVQKKLARVFNIADKIHTNTTSEEIVRESVENTLGKYPEGTIITEEILEEFAKEFSKRAAPFIAHINKERKK